MVFIDESSSFANQVSNRFGFFLFPERSYHVWHDAPINKLNAHLDDRTVPLNNDLNSKSWYSNGGYGGYYLPNPIFTTH